MSDNIHGFGETEPSDNNNNNNDNQYSYDDPTPILLKRRYTGDPREQSIPNYLKETLYPFFRFKSFSFIIIVVNVAIYIISLCPHGLNDNNKDLYFLPPHYQTLRDFGDLYGYKIRCKPIQAYRWIAGNLLHASFEHILYNCFAILIIGTMLEYLIGIWRYIAIYCLSGLLGSLFSALIEPDVASVGASICICGVIAADIGFHIINWNILPKIFGIPNRCCLIMFPIIIAFLQIPMYVNSEGDSDISKTNINIYGHLGGLIFGFFMSFIFIKPRDESDTCFLPYKTFFILGIVVCSAFALIGFPCFYLLNKYKSDAVCKKN